MDRKIALITGVGRLQGIGRAICNVLAKDGFDIFFTYWSDYDEQMPWKVGKDEPDLIQQEIIKLGVKCAKLELDLTTKNATDILLKEVTKQLGNPLVLVNNATYSTQTSIRNLTDTELDKHYMVNLKATTLLSTSFINQFAFDKNGRIINITSGQSLGEMPNEVAYAITKAGVETLTKTISQYIATKGITINAVNPGPNDTGWMDENLKAELLKRFPMKRIGTPKDTANIVRFLASEDAEWITGQIIHSEGGFQR